MTWTILAEFTEIICAVRDRITMDIDIIDSELAILDCERFQTRHPRIVFNLGNYPISGHHLSCLHVDSSKQITLQF